MTIKMHAGSCHCGAVRFEADMDLGAGTTRCNCSLCSKTRAWFEIVPAEHFRLLAGEDAMADYQWKAPQNTEPHLHYRFCKTCGVRAFAMGDPPGGAKFYAVAISTLDDADPDELAGSLHYVDGRHDRFDIPPQDTRLM